MNLFEAGIERYAACLLTSHRSVSAYIYKDQIFFVSERINPEGGLPITKGLWMLSKGSLQPLRNEKLGITKCPLGFVMMTFSKGYLGCANAVPMRLTWGNNSMYGWHGLALVGGVFHNGICLSTVRVADDRAAKELEEAPECFSTAAKIQEDTSTHTSYKMTEYYSTNKDSGWPHLHLDEEITAQGRKGYTEFLSG